MLAIEYHVHIWQLRWHLSNMNEIQRIYKYFREIENFSSGEIDVLSFITPHPRSADLSQAQPTAKS